MRARFVTILERVWRTPGRLESDVCPAAARMKGAPLRLSCCSAGCEGSACYQDFPPVARSRAGSAFWTMFGLTIPMPAPPPPSTDLGAQSEDLVVEVELRGGLANGPSDRPRSQNRARGNQVQA